MLMQISVSFFIKKCNIVSIYLYYLTNILLKTMTQLNEWLKDSNSLRNSTFYKKCIID